MSLERIAIKEQMAQYLKIPLDRMQDDAQLRNIIPDSFMLVELLIELQEEYAMQLNQADIEKIHTVSDLTELVAVRAAQ
jgi:acyl carrier protein